MTSQAKLTSSRACVVVAWGILVTSSMLMCACPGWPAMGVGLAIAAIWLRQGVKVLNPLLALAACLIMTGVHVQGLRSERKARDRSLQFAKQRQAGASLATNPLPQLIKP